MAMGQWLWANGYGPMAMGQWLWANGYGPMAMGQWLWLAKKCYIHRLANRFKKIASLADAIGQHSGKLAIN
jgi:hypothetical protein